jgi:hypothetical protein
VCVLRRKATLSRRPLGALLISPAITDFDACNPRLEMQSQLLDVDT